MTDPNLEQQELGDLAKALFGEQPDTHAPTDTEPATAHVAREGGNPQASDDRTRRFVRDFFNN